jgi:hypothetical protein
MIDKSKLPGAIYRRQTQNVLLMFFVLLNTCCAGNSVSQSSGPGPLANPSVPIASPSESTEVTHYIPDQFGEPIGAFINTYTSDRKLSYLRYEVVKATRKSQIGSSGHFTDVEYAVLRRNGRIVAKFDSSIDELGEVRFGLFSFLGDGTKHLVVEQTSNKFWRYWIVSFEPTVRVIYDSGKYDVVNELRTADIDGEGRLEVFQNLGSFWYFNLDNVYSPRPPIIFKYQLSAHKYAPANPEFGQAALKDIDQRIAKTRQVIESKDDPAYVRNVRSAVLDVVLRYLYAGKGNEAWAFYEHQYNLEDKTSLRNELKKKLGHDALYREITRETPAER